MRDPLLFHEEKYPVRSAPGLRHRRLVEIHIRALAENHARFSRRILVHEVKFSAEIKDEAASGVKAAFVEHLVVRRDPRVDVIGCVRE